jgi:hypothetical protein
MQTSKQLIDNKIIISSKNSWIVLVGEEEIIHLFNNSSQQLTCNLVTQADNETFLS